MGCLLIILGPGSDFSLDIGLQKFNQNIRSTREQPFPKSIGCVFGKNLFLKLGKDGAVVKLGIKFNYAHSRLGCPRGNSSLNRGGPPEKGEEGRVQVKYSVFEIFQNRLRNYFSVCSQNSQICFDFILD